MAQLPRLESRARPQRRRDVARAARAADTRPLPYIDMTTRPHAPDADRAARMIFSSSTPCGRVGRAYRATSYIDWPRRLPPPRGTPPRPSSARSPLPGLHISADELRVLRRCSGNAPAVNLLTSASIDAHGVPLRAAASPDRADETRAAGHQNLFKASRSIYLAARSPASGGFLLPALLPLRLDRVFSLDEAAVERFAAGPPACRTGARNCVRRREPSRVPNRERRWPESMRELPQRSRLREPFAAVRARLPASRASSA